VAELDGAGNLVSEFIYGTKSNVPDLVVRGGVAYRVVSDQLGSPVLAVNAANSSDVQFQASYAAFGERTLIAGADDWMPFGFAGGIYDPDARLTRFGKREYHSQLGRWTTKDPVRFRGGQVNIYAYVDNDPVNRVDPRGTNKSGDLIQCETAVVICSISCDTAENPISGGACVACLIGAIFGTCGNANIPDDDYPPEPPDPPPPPGPPQGCEGSGSH